MFQELTTHDEDMIETKIEDEKCDDEKDAKLMHHEGGRITSSSIPKDSKSDKDQKGDCETKNQKNSQGGDPRTQEPRVADSGQSRQIRKNKIFNDAI